MARRYEHANYSWEGLSDAAGKKGCKLGESVLDNYLKWARARGWALVSHSLAENGPSFVWESEDAISSPDIMAGGE